MATTKAPLFGLDASGSLAKSIVFSKWKGRTYVRRHAVPSNPNTGNQFGIRTYFKWLTQQWASLSAGDQSYWDAIAADKQTTGLNEFVSFNMKRAPLNLSPLQNPTATPGTQPSTPATWTATAATKSIVLDWTAGATAPTWGWAIFRSLTGTFTRDISNLRMMIPAADLTIRDKPLITGVAYFYEIAGFGINGPFANASAEVTATPT